MSVVVCGFARMHTFDSLEWYFILVHAVSSFSFISFFVLFLLGLKTFATFLTLDWNDVHSAAYRGLKSFLLVLIWRVSI